MIVSGINLSFLSKGNDHPISLRFPISMMAHFIERARAAGVPVTLLTCGLGIWKRKGVTTYLFQVLETTKLSVFKLTSHTQNQMNKQAGLH